MWVDQIKPVQKLLCVKEQKLVNSIPHGHCGNLLIDAPAGGFQPHRTDISTPPWPGQMGERVVMMYETM